MYRMQKTATHGLLRLGVQQRILTLTSLLMNLNVSVSVMIRHFSTSYSIGRHHSLFTTHLGFDDCGSNLRENRPSK